MVRSHLQMEEERLTDLLKRFLGTRRYVWYLIVVAVLLALATNLLASVVYAEIGSYPSLGLGIFLGVGCFGYLIYARSQDNVFSATISGFFAVQRDSGEPIYVPAYSLASEFRSIADAAFKENPALEKQWRTEIQQIFDRSNSKSINMRIAIEIIEYILLETLSTHLTDYFNTPALEQSQLEVLEREDIPDVLLSNRILELISRELRDRPWYQPKDDADPDSGGTVVAVYGADHRYSYFDLTLPKGSTVRRIGPGRLIISGKLITLELTASVEGDLANMVGLFAEYYLGLEEVWSIDVTYNIRARLRRRLGLKMAGWRYNSWIESFTEAAAKQLDSDRFFQRISWNATEALLRVISAKYPTMQPRVSETGQGVTVERNESQASDGGSA